MIKIILIIFNATQCLVINQINKQVKLVGKRINNIYMIDLDFKIILDATCLMSLNEDTWIWHKRLTHASMDLIRKLSKKDLVVSLPKLNYIKDRICDACQKGKTSKLIFSIKKDCFNLKTIGSLAYGSN